MINAKEILQRHCFISEEFVVRKCKTLDELITEYVALYGNLCIHEAKISDELYEESWIATDEEVHRFLSKYLWKLSLNDVII